MAPVTPRQASICNSLRLAWLVLCLNLGHQTIAAYVGMGLTTTAYTQCTTHGFGLHVFPKVPLQVQKTL
jgi:hypothetical protein